MTGGSGWGRLRRLLEDDGPPSRTAAGPKGKHPDGLTPAERYFHGQKVLSLSQLIGHIPLRGEHAPCFGRKAPITVSWDGEHATLHQDRLTFTGTSARTVVSVDGQVVAVYELGQRVEAK